MGPLSWMDRASRVLAFTLRALWRAGLGTALTVRTTWIGPLGLMDRASQVLAVSEPSGRSRGTRMRPLSWMDPSLAGFGCS
jgi:hypothetical protein